MRHIRAILAASLVLATLTIAPARAASVTRTPVSFTVTNPLTPGSEYTVRGVLVRPDGCTNTVLLAEHGLSYGAWAWDFPLDPATYSAAQALAERGYATVAIDELGYGASDHPNGYTLTVESYADITRQIVEELRAGSYGGPAFSHVGLIGHSAGAEIVELAAGLYGGVDVVIPTGYQHALDGVSNDWLLREWIPGDVVRSAQSDYEYFETDPQTRAADMYNLSEADDEVVALDTSLANLTPSGEILTISEQPSRYVLGNINVPVLLVLAEKDALFPSSAAQTELSLFTGTTDKSLYVVPDAGHVFLLHRSAPATNDVIADWLDSHQAATPKC